MINGTYRVSFEVTLKNHASEEEAHESIKGMVNELLEEDNFPELNFELVEEEDEEYETEEEVEELNFGSAG